MTREPATTADAVREYYATFGQGEWHRLLTSEGRLEFAITTALLDQHLPSTGRVLDIGGGPGRYAAWLANRGLEVSLADLSPDLLEIARANLAPGSVRETVEADARNLSRWGADEFDAVVCLGPFYHLTTPDDRRAATAELRRVVRPGGLVAVALMPKYGYLRRTVAVHDERHHLDDEAFLRRVVEDGVFVNDVPGRFTHGFGVEPSDVGGPFEDAGLQTITVASTHGFATGIEDQLDTLRAENPVAYGRTLELLIQTASDPSLFGTAGHLLYLGRRPGTGSPRFGQA